MTLARKLGLSVVALLAAMLCAALWILATEPGTRWMLQRAAAFAPEQLAIGNTEGSLLRGVSAQSIAWHDESISVRAADVYLEAQLLPLLLRNVRIDVVQVGSLNVDFGAGSDSKSAGELPSVKLPIDLYLMAAFVRDITLTSGEVSRKVDDIQLAANLVGPELDVSKLTFRSTWLDADIEGRVTLTGLYQAVIDGNWRWKESGSGPFAGKLHLEGDIERLALQHSLTAPLAVSTSGTVSIEPGAPAVDLLNEWQLAEWPVQQYRLKSSGGTLRLQGTPADLSIELDATVSLDDHAETLLLASGAAALDPDPSFDLEFQVSGVDPSLFADVLSGALQARGRAAARISDKGTSVQLQFDKLGGELNDQAVDGQANISSAGNRLSITGTRIQVGNNSLRIDGTVNDSISLDADIDITDVSALLPGAAGKVEGMITLRGPRADPDVQLEVQAASISWGEYSIDSLFATADLSAKRRGNAELILERLTIGDNVLDSARASLSGKLESHTLRATLRGYDTELGIDASGALAGRAWAGQLESLTVDNDSAGLWSTREPGDLELSATHILLSRTCLFENTHGGAACAAASRRADESVSFEVSTTGLPLSAVPAPRPEGVNLQGHIDARLDGEWRDRKLTADGEIELHNARIETVYEDEPLYLAASRAVGRATILGNSLQSSVEVELVDGAGSARLQLDVANLADSTSAISGRGDLSINDTSMLAVFVPSASDPRGTIEGGMTIAGSLSAPDFRGDIAWTDGAVGVRPAGIVISDINVRLTQRAPGQLSLDGSARSGDGQIRITGLSRVGSDTGVRTEIDVVGEQFELLRLPDWQLAASPAVNVVFDDRAVTVRGELTIPKADIAVRDVPDTATAPSPDAVVHRSQDQQPAAARRIDVDIRTVLGDDVQLSGFGLTTGLEGAVQLQGGSDVPWSGRGRLLLRDGRYKAYGQELEIERGVLIFAGPLENPQLDVRAIRRAGDVIAGIEIAGTPTQLQSRVFSEPGMSDAEALSYLLTGRPLASATSSGDGDVLASAAFALGVSGAGSITSQIRTDLGLDTLAVEGGASDGRLIAGKRFGDRLLVEYGYGLIDKLGTLLLRYQLNDRITLESRTGTVSNLDIVYSVKKK